MPRATSASRLTCATGSSGTPRRALETTRDLEPEIRAIGTWATTDQTVTRPAGFKLASSSFDSWFGVVAEGTARVRDDDNSSPTLMIEVPGTTIDMGLPLVHTGTNNYTLHFEGFDFEIHGTLVHGPTTMSITVTSGSWGGTSLPAGTYNFPKR